jgi:uncharacterized membrane protein
MKQLVLAFFLLATSHASAATADDIEEIQVLPTIPVTAEKASDTPQDAITVFGRFHAAAVHIPIGWALLAVMFECVVFGLKRLAFERISFAILVLADLSFVPAVVSGLLRVKEFNSEQVADALLHRNFMLIAWAVVTAAIGIRLILKHRLFGAWRFGYLTLLLALMAVIAYGGHLGGRLVYGDDYLPF